MPQQHPMSHAVIALTAAGVTALIDLSDGRLPVLAHWGHELPDLDAAQASALIVASMPVAGSNNLDPPPRPAILPEHHSGWIGRPGLRGSHAGRSWSPAFTTHSVRLDGARVSGFAASGPGVVETSAQDDTGSLDLQLLLELLPSGLLRTRARITNTAAGIYQVEDLVLAFPVPSEANELLDFAGRHNLERFPQRTAFTTGAHVRENRRGRTGADSAYVLHAGTPGFGFGYGEVYATHTAWSGNHTHYAEKVSTGEQLIGGGELLLPGEIRLDAGASYQTPWVYGSYGTGLDEVARRFHRHLRSRSQQRVSSNRPVTLNVWEAVYFEHVPARLLDLADRAAAIGVERYVLDDGWFGSRRDDRSGLGDWYVSPEVWPGGLHQLVDHVRGLGMQFGLWFEPEMVNPDSELARAHPEWIMAARTDWPLESRHQHVLNLGIPEAFEHVKAQILALLEDYPIEYIKWDHNRDLLEAGDQTDGGRPGVHAQTLAFYRLLDDIRAAHPGLEIESCSSGGARIDLGVLERTDRVWVSDNIDPHDRQNMLRWTTQLVPPEYLGSHIASGRSHTTGRRHDLGFRAATAIFGHLGIEWDLTEATGDEVHELQAWIAFYKEQRGLLLDGDVVRMDDVPGNTLMHGVVARDQSRAIFSVTTMSSSYPDPSPRMKFRDLDPRRTYRLRPILIERAPSGLRPPQWWNGPAGTTGVVDGPFHRSPVTGFEGQLFTGAALRHAGVASPRVHPDQVVLYRADAEPSSDLPPSHHKPDAAAKAPAMKS